MNNFQKKELKIIWNHMSDEIKTKISRQNITITETYFFSQNERDSYIAIGFDNILVFFIFKMEDELVELFSYKSLDTKIVEVAIIIKNNLENTIFRNKSVKTKARKSD